MSEDWLHGEVLKSVFPLLDGKDLASCMLVCRQWREIAGEDYFWKCICVKRWPSICKRPLPVRSYHKFFLTFSRPQRPQPLLPPRLSFNDLEFYIDIWSEQKLIFSEAISGSVLQTGIKNPPSGIPDILKLHLDGPDYKMIVPVEPRLTIALGSKIRVSVLASRKDTNQVACIVRDSVFDYVDGSASRALAYAYLNFSPGHPFISEIRAWVSLLFMADGNDNAIDVFGIEIDFVDAASKEHEEKCSKAALADLCFAPKLEIPSIPDVLCVALLFLDVISIFVVCWLIMSLVPASWRLHKYRFNFGP